MKKLPILIALSAAVLLNACSDQTTKTYACTGIEQSQEFRPNGDARGAPTQTVKVVKIMVLPSIERAMIDGIEHYFKKGETLLSGKKSAFLDGGANARHESSFVFDQKALTFTRTDVDSATYGGILRQERSILKATCQKTNAY